MFLGHVSASGNDLAALTTNGRLVILPGFQRLFTGSNTVHHRDIAIILNFSFQSFSSDEDISCYLALGGRNGKLAIATVCVRYQIHPPGALTDIPLSPILVFQRKGIYVISPDFGFTRLTADCPPEPGVSVCRLSKFEDDRLLFYISCLQITHDAIYFTYKPTPTGSSLDTAHHAHVHGAGVHDPPDMEVLPEVADVMEDGPADEWDEDFEFEEVGMGVGGDDGQYLQHLSSPVIVLMLL